MKRIHSLILVLLVLFAAAPCVADGTGPAGCSFSGTWYGGDPNVPAPYYHLTITQTSGDRYSTLAQLVPSVPLPPGYVNVTLWTGEFSKTGPQTHSGMFFSMAQWDPTSKDVPVGIDPNTPELNFIHAKQVEFLDCNTIRFTYDVLYVYENYTYAVEPIQTPPTGLGAIVNFDPSLVEVYHRVPTSLSGSHQTMGWPPRHHHGRRGH